MQTEHEARHIFARQFSALLDECELSARALRQLAHVHGIGYSTLHSWRTGQHLPRVPDDNPCFRGFVTNIAINQAVATATLTAATKAWRRYVAAKRDNAGGRDRRLDVLSAHLLRSRSRLVVIWGPEGTGRSSLARRLAEEVGWEPFDVELRGSTPVPVSPDEAMTAFLDSVGISCGPDAVRRTYRHLLASRPMLLRFNDASTASQVLPLLPAPGAAPTIITSRHPLPELEERGAMRMRLGPRLTGSQVREREQDRPRELTRDLAVRYTKRTALAAAAVYPDMPLLVDASLDPTSTGFASDRHATAWLTTERDNLLATATAALGEHADLACQLADALRAFQQVLPHSVDWTPVAEAGLRAAREVGCPKLTAAMHLATGVAYSGIGTFGRAVAHLRLAYDGFLALRMTRERAHICLVLSSFEHAVGDLRAARAHCAESLRLRQRMGSAAGRTSSLVFLADIEADLGQFAQTERKAMAALALGRECGYTAGVAGALGILGRIALDRRRLDDANRHFTEQFAVAEHHAFGSRKAIALVGLARVRQHAGQHEEATRFADAAAATARDWGNAAAYVDALNVAGAAHLARSRYRDAVSCHRRAAEKAHHTGYQRGHAESLIAMSSAAAASW